MNKDIIFESLKLFKNEDTAVVLFIEKSIGGFTLCWSFGHAMSGPKGAPYEKLFTVSTLEQAELILSSLAELATAATVLQLDGNHIDEVKIKKDGEIYLEPTYS